LIILESNQIQISEFCYFKNPNKYCSMTTQ
jgi:hypothetical protein